MLKGTSFSADKRNIILNHNHFLTVYPYLQQVNIALLFVMTTANMPTKNIFIYNFLQLAQLLFPRLYFSKTLSGITLQPNTGMYISFIQPSYSLLKTVRARRPPPGRNAGRPARWRSNVSKRELQAKEPFLERAGSDERLN